MTHISNIKLIKTNTILYLSQKAGKTMLSLSLHVPLMFQLCSPFFLSHHGTYLASFYSHHKLFCKISGLNLTFCLVIYYLTIAGLCVRRDIIEADKHNSDYHQLVP